MLEKGEGMESVMMTLEELRDRIRSLPEGVLLRVTVQEAGDGSDETETI